MSEGFSLYEWFYDDEETLCVTLKSDSGKYITRTYEKKGWYSRFMRNHGLWNEETKEIARFLWG